MPKVISFDDERDEAVSNFLSQVRHSLSDNTFVAKCSLYFYILVINIATSQWALWAA